ncbi:MAG: helix-turn-helix domain-containing protein [Bacilli bacterium]|jgi:putative transcriptional regulator|nr:helix-turn-helix domain-containing protein [Staphylococcus sp.]
MLSRLKDIYQDKLQEEVTQITDNYYYFYKDKTTCDIFAISKTISQNEYHLLKELYIEKRIYTYNNNLQKIYEYLLENKEYPFKIKKIRMIIFQLNKEDISIVQKMLSDLYQRCYFLELYNLNICFLEENQTKIKDLFEALSADLGYDIILHEGLILNSKYSGKEILEYIKVYHDNEIIHKKVYTDLADVILSLGMGDYEYLKRSLKKNLLLPLFQDATTREIISVMFKNDLNVSQTSKLLYMNRNSLINRLDNILKETGLNLQKFTHACAIYQMINLN